MRLGVRMGMVQFSDFAADLAGGRLWRGGIELQLRPKSFEVLSFLLSNPGRVVTKDEILQAVWREVFVTDDSLIRCISDIRSALGDADQQLIRTVAKRGYVLDASVEQERDRRGATVGELEKAGSAQERGPSLAVLPFTNVSADLNQEYLADGITDGIIFGLSQFAEMSVIARNSSFTYKGRAVDIREVGRELAVQYIVEGSVQRVGERIRIIVHLSDAESRLRRWSDRFDRALGDLFAVQDEIAQAVVRTVVAHVGAAESDRARRKPPTSWTAYDLLMQGDHAWRALEQTWEPRHLADAHRLYLEAYKADPDNSLICGRLSLSFMRIHADPSSTKVGDPESLKQGRELALRSVSLDPNQPFARARLGWALFWMTKIDEALGEFEKALALNANFADVHFPAVLNFAGEPERALNLLQMMQRLDPFHPSQVHAIQGHSLYLAGKYKEALVPLRECIRRGPKGVLGHVWLSAVLVRLGELTEARATVSEVMSRLPHLTLSRWRLFEFYRNPQTCREILGDLHAAGMR